MTVREEIRAALANGATLTRAGKPPATRRVVMPSPERDFIFAVDADERFLALGPDGNHILFSPEQTLKIADLMFRNFTADA